MKKGFDAFDEEVYKNQLDGVIAFWKGHLKNKGLFEPSTQVLLHYTIRYLEDLRKTQ